MPRFGTVPLDQVAKACRPEWERAITAVAEPQHGVITLAQLQAIGLSDSAIRRRAGVGRLHRLYRGVYATTGAPISRHGHWLAAVLACGEGAVLSHRTAAALWGIRESSAATIDITYGGRTGPRRDGLRVHRADCLDDADRDLVLGVPCTTVARTLVDLAGVLSPDALEYSLHRAETKRLVTTSAVAATVARFPTRRGTAALRRILGLSIEGEGKVNSPLERRFLRLCAAANLPLPEANRWVSLPQGHGLEVDFCWPQHRLIVECDSRGYHATARAFENDRRRDRLLVAAGWTVLRFTHRDLRERPDAVVAEVRTVLAQRVGTLSGPQ